MKTRGSHDLRRRKRRSDIGKRRALFMGKKPKPRRKNSHGVFVPYVSHRSRNDPIKVWFWDVQKMSLNGFHHFNKNVRLKVRRIVYGKNRIRVDVDPEQLSTRENIAQLGEELLWEGSWYLMLWSGSKNKFHTSAKCVAVLQIKETSLGLKCRVIPSHNHRSLRKYWFWRDK
jgi:hypothetical protein